MIVIIVLLVALSFGLLVIGHEFGHFILAKINGVKVEEFSLGMGPLILKFQGKETMYSLRLLPIGGYVKMLGEYEENDENISEEDKNKSYMYKHPLRKISIILAGPIMNFIMAFLIFWGLNSFNGYSSTTISEIEQGSPAEVAGLQVGDRIVKLNSKGILNFRDFVFKLQTLENKESINLEVERNNEILNLDVRPIVEDNSILIGVRSKFIKDVGFFEGISNGFKDMIFEIKQIGTSIWWLITGKVSFKDLGGPVTIFRASGQAAKAGIAQLLNFTAFLSVNLGVFNLIPFPALDGGSFIINLVELVFKKKIKQEVLAKINFVGFAILILLMIAITIKDIFFPVNL